jgi:Neuraminidase (sialidase)
MANNKPIKKFRAGNMSVSIFDNTAKKDGKEFSYKTIVLQRSYTKDEGKTWVNEAINLRNTDIIKALIVLNTCMNELYLNKDEEDEE